MEKMLPARILKSKKAQAMTEYILIVACIALICMAGAKVFQAGMVNAFKHFVMILCFPIP